MKKTLSMLVALVITLSMVACGLSDKNTDSTFQNSNSNSFTSTTTTTTTAKPTTTTPATTITTKKASKFDDYVLNESIRNDTTGNWKSVLVAEKLDVVKNAVDLYDYYFDDNKTILAVINMSTKTTAKISVLYDGTLDVTIYGYVDGEEHDANLMFSGNVLSEYWVTIKDGKSEKIQ